MTKEKCPKCGGRGMYHDFKGYRMCECKKEERKKVVSRLKLNFKNRRKEAVERMLQKSAEKRAKEWLKEKQKNQEVK